VEYLAFRARQRRGWEAPVIAAGIDVSLFVDADGQLLSCGKGAIVGHNCVDHIYPDPTPVAFMAGVRVRCVAAAVYHSLAVGWDGRVYSWGMNDEGQLGQGDRLTRPAPALVEGLEGVRDVAAAAFYSFAVTQSGDASPGALPSMGHWLIVPLAPAR
jgi:alpha-tubulin suppressor-like RCC1 family protein